MAKHKANWFFEPQRQTYLSPRTAEEAIQLLNERVQQLDLDLEHAKTNSWVTARDERGRAVLAAIVAIFSTLETDDG